MTSVCCDDRENSSLEDDIIRIAAHKFEEHRAIEDAV